MSFEEPLTLVVMLATPLVVIALCCWLVAYIAIHHTAHNCRAQARKLTTALIALAGTGIVVTLIGIGAATRSLPYEPARAEMLSYSCAYAAFGILLSLTFYPVFRLQSSLRRMDSDDGHVNLDKIDRAIATVRMIGWSSAIAGFVFAMAMLNIGLLLLFAISAIGLIPTLAWQRQRTQEVQFLWLLALSVRNKHDLAQEIEDHASNWSGSYAIKLRQVVSYLRDGRSLGTALGYVPTLLPRWTVAAIQIGETSGTLNEVLTECATAQFKWMKDRFRAGSISGLLLYLSCYLWATIIPVTFVWYYIIPKYKAIFEGFGTELPTLTQTFIAACDAMLPLLFVLAPVSLAFVRALLRFDEAGWRNVRMRLFRGLYPRYDTSPLLRHLSRMIDAGKTLPDSLLTIANTYHRPTVAEAIARVYVEVSSGGDCWKGLLRTGFISRRDLALIEAAQRNGNLSWALNEIAHVRENRYLFRIDTACQLFRPVPVIAMGLLVCWVCIAMFLPLIKLVNDLS